MTTPRTTPPGRDARPSSSAPRPPSDVRGGPTGGATSGGKPGDASTAPSGMPPRRTWAAFLVILIVNFLLARFLFPGAGEPVKVPYTLFKQEVGRRNVEAIFSQGASLTGRFLRPVVYPPPADSADTTARAARPGRTAREPQPVTDFSTTLPAFVDPGLESLLIANGVELS